MWQQWGQWVDTYTYSHLHTHIHTHTEAYIKLQLLAGTGGQCLNYAWDTHNAHTATVSTYTHTCTSISISISMQPDQVIQFHACLPSIQASKQQQKATFSGASCASLSLSVSVSVSLWCCICVCATATALMLSFYCSVDTCQPKKTNNKSLQQSSHANIVIRLGQNVSHDYSFFFPGNMKIYKNVR